MAILRDFQEAYPAQSEDMELLQFIAKVPGNADVNRMLGSAICESDVSRIVKLETI